jgi:hypothetical protein
MNLKKLQYYPTSLMASVTPGTSSEGCGSALTDIKQQYSSKRINVLLSNYHDLGTNLTRLWLTGLFKNKPSDIWNSSLVRSNRYSRRMLTTAILISIIDMCRPMQLRGPPLNGEGVRSKLPFRQVAAILD